VSRILLVAISFMIGFVGKLEAEPHFPSNEDLRQLRSISNPRLSPDGRYVVLQMQDSTKAGGATHLWVVTVQGSSYRQLTFGSATSKSESDPLFLPGGTLLFRAGTRLFRMFLDGKHPVEIRLRTASTPGALSAIVAVDSYAVSPSGKTIAVIATDPDPRERSTERKERRDVQWVDHDRPRNRVYLVDTSDWKTAEVPSLSDIDSVSWSAQSDRLLVLTHTRPDDFGFSTSAVIVTVSEPSSQTRIAGIPESTRRAAWLHNGKGLVLFAQCEEDAPLGSSDLYTLDLTAGRLTHLKAGTTNSTLSLPTLIIAGDDRSALIALTRGVKRTIGRVDLDTGTLDTLDLGAPVITDFSQQQEGENEWVYLASSSVSPPAVYVSNALGQPGKRLVQPEVAPGDWRSVAPSIISWQRDGLTLEGLFYRPPESLVRRVPMVVIAHGGPPGQFTDGYLPLTNLLLGRGWAVFLPNPRGSTGYGIAFEAANKGDLGNGDFLDIMAGVDELVRSEPVSPDHLAMIGHSYGGEMAAFAEGKTSRFKAIVCSAPITDQISEQGTASEAYPDSWFTGLPWVNFESAWRQSPLAYAKNATTPLLLLQGENDTSDPPGQSMQLYRALRAAEVPVEMYLFPRENHSSLGRQFSGLPSVEPWHGVMLRDYMISFIEDAFSGKRGKKKAN